MYECEDESLRLERTLRLIAFVRFHNSERYWAASPAPRFDCDARIVVATLNSNEPTPGCVSAGIGITVLWRATAAPAHTARAAVNTTALAPRIILEFSRTLDTLTHAVRASRSGRYILKRAVR